MIHFQVDWTRDALDDLADLWLRAADRNAVTLAAAIIDQSLGESPHDWGTELSEGLREFIAPPLRVLFTIDDAAQMVDVARVLPFRRGRR